MTSRTVTTQAELDAALADAVDRIIIDSPSDTWLTITDSGSSHVEACGSSNVTARESSHVTARESSTVEALESSTVEACGSSHVEACGSSHVTARGSSHVTARESSHVTARESSTVEALESSTVEACGSSHVEAWGSSRVTAWGSSHVTAWELSHVTARESSTVEALESSTVEALESSAVEACGSSHVTARESSHVTARESSHVTARGSSRVTALESSTVEAWGSSHVTAGRYVAVHLHSAAATVTGGVVIDITNLDLADPTIWCDYHGVTVADGTAVVYKAVSPQLAAGQKHIQTTYTIGETVTATDWKPTTECGHGLHFGDTPRRALIYYQGGDRTTARFLACEITVAGSVPLGDKVKAPSCRVLHEVNLDGEVIA